MAWTAPRTWVTGELVTAAIQNTHIRDNQLEIQAVAEGDTGATLEHRHKAGTLANRPTPGEAGRIYLATDVGLTLYDDGTEWLIGPPLPQKGTHFFDDFHKDFTSDWGVALTGSAVVSMVAGVGGEVQLDTSTTANSNAKLLLPTDGSLATIDPGKAGLLIIRLVNAGAAATNQFQHDGLMDSVPSGNSKPANGIYIEKDDAGNFFGVCRASSAESTQDLGTTGISKTLFIIERTGTGVKFYVDTLAAAGLQGSEITTNVPSADLIIAHRISNKAAAASRAFKLDTFGIWMAR